MILERFSLGHAWTVTTSYPAEAGCNSRGHAVPGELRPTAGNVNNFYNICIKLLHASQ